MESNEVDLKKNIKEEISSIEPWNTFKSQKLTQSTEEKADCNILDGRFEDISSRGISCSEDVDPLSIGLKKHYFLSLPVTSSEDKVSLDLRLLKHEDKYSPQSTFIFSEEFYPDVCTNRYDMQPFALCLLHFLVLRGY